MTKTAKSPTIKEEGHDWSFPELGITIRAESYKEALEKLELLQKGKK